jgi:dUTP pyrophosphatase
MIAHTHQKMYDIYYNLKLRSNSASTNFAILKLAVEDNQLKKVYESSIEKHNSQFSNDSFADSGFDVFVPDDHIFDQLQVSTFIDMDVKAEMMYCNLQGDMLNTTGFTMHPRSSISKTPLMLANHTGIIDSGYRGNLIGAFRALHFDNTNQYVVKKHNRLVQICHPTLCPIYVVLVNENELSNTTRNTGGFGSTGV